jgi:L-seryl-tRNA(Ser) seleniumtransferase
MAIRQVGVELVEIGHARGTAAWELEEAIGPETAAVAYVYARWTFDLPLTLAETVRIAHARDVPVIVDGAAEVPPFRNLRGLVDTGADLVVISGGKGIMGPQNTGLVLGRLDLIEACAANASPNHAVGRSMKVSKEEIVGITKAVELFVKQDHAAVERRWHEQVEAVMRAMGTVRGVRVAKDEAPYSEGVPVAKVFVDPALAGRTAEEIAAELLDGEPGVKVNQAKDWLSVNPQFLEVGEEALVIERLRAALGAGALVGVR